MHRTGPFIPWIVFVAAVALYLAILPLATVPRQHQEQRFTLPPKVLRVVSLQFKEVVSDITFLNALTYIGGIRVQPDTHRYLPEQYELIYSTLKNSVALDPNFLDPYYLMNSALIWDRYKLAEVNDLIAKGADTRNWDYSLSFFAGFNYYYFLNDTDKSFYYLTQAAKLSDNNPFFASLAAKVAYKANKTELAISYLEQQIKEAKQQDLKSFVVNLERRLDLLKGIRQIELSVEGYKKMFNKPPSNINELLTLKLLPSIPKEPNGGSYYLESDGKVKSTIDLK